GDDHHRARFRSHALARPKGDDDRRSLPLANRCLHHGDPIPRRRARRVGRDLQLSALADFLALPRVAVLATYRRDGTVLLSPVWHTWRDGGFDVLTEV